MMMSRTKLFIFSLFTLASFSAPALSSQHDDAFYMRSAIDEAKQNPQAPFGAVIVSNKTGDILCEGFNSAVKDHNPSYHGEMVAINNCARKFPHLDWTATTLYTTAEPCPMCQSAIVWAGISRMVYGTSITTLKKMGWGQINISSAEVNRKSHFYKGTITGDVLAGETDPMFIRKP